MKMLKNIVLIILSFILLASPAFGDGWNRNLDGQVNNPGIFMTNRPDSSTQSFKNRHSRLLVKPQDRTRIPKFIGFPYYYGMDGLGNYEDGDYQTVNIIVDSSKKDEPTGLPAKKETPIAPPHIVTLEDPGSSKGFKPANRSERIIEMRGTKVSTTSLPQE